MQRRRALVALEPSRNEERHHGKSLAAVSLNFDRDCHD